VNIPILGNSARTVEKREMEKRPMEKTIKA
jgi:hypothetical protein